jgi:GT2 family glycosyltransferase
MTNDMPIQPGAKTSSSPVVSVVLLSYKRPAYLREALAALLAQSYENLEITVVDNPSPASEEIAQFVNQYPNVTLIQHQVNLGYTGGMNKGIASAFGDYICLTEDDIVMDQDCIQRLVEYMDHHPSTGLIAPIIYNKAGRTIRWAGGHFELGGVYQMKIFGAGESDIGQFPNPFEVNFIDGATMFARTELWKSLNGFREDFFMYAEAVDFSIRVAKAGMKLEVVPQAKVYHFEPPESPTPPEIEFHKIKNFFSLYLLHAPLRNLLEFVCRYAVLNTLRSMLSRQGNTLLRLRALLWVLKRMPFLLKERYRNASPPLDFH